jgi:uncharacterized protein YndB with AHSA1/START domain
MTETSTDYTVRLQRTIPAPPDRVYRAWLDPEVVRKWFAPASLFVTKVDIDERVGGHHRIWQEGPEGEGGGFDSDLVELVPGRRIVFRWRFVGPERVADPTHDSILTVTFDDAPGGGTALTLVHERLEALHAAIPFIVENAEEGWVQALDKLASTLAPQPDAA